MLRWWLLSLEGLKAKFSGILLGEKTTWPSGDSECRWIIRDQYGKPLCMKNLDAPGFCDGIENCPYNKRG